MNNTHISTKTPAGMRDIPISNALRPWLEKALDEFQENDLGLLFYNFRADGIIESHQMSSTIVMMIRSALSTLISEPSEGK